MEALVLLMLGGLTIAAVEPGEAERRRWIANVEAAQCHPDRLAEVRRVLTTNPDNESQAAVDKGWRALSKLGELCEHLRTYTPSEEQAWVKTLGEIIGELETIE